VRPFLAGLARGVYIIPSKLYGFKPPRQPLKVCDETIVLNTSLIKTSNGSLKTSNDSLPRPFLAAGMDQDIPDP
jgi:hypothetical protein